ncbi:thioredoxin domain-containing protein [Microbacterium sp. ARD32]|uniref:DsbA family protein n=1 Tax=Microbacterium sp. ARD32 TaxID=2962577 RepID=UPI0028810C97|nr:thioredoxin domain-containing protein [Microbacterium sp. ARD32]MDT0158399.1 thioredoxin domain-containing protein [Microbacterium sp. ARD32]
MAQAQSKPNWFVIGISAAVVVVLVALGLVVVWMNNRATDAGPAPSSSKSFDAETGAIAFGDGDDVVDVFVDFQCPVCKSFEEQFGAQLMKAADDDKITLNYHPIAILDRYSQGTEYSSRSASAAVCVAESDPDEYLDFAQLLFDNQPEENTTGLETSKLAELAEQAGADEAASCITDETYKKFGVAQAKKHEIAATPTVDLNGTRLNLQDQADLQKLVKLIS